LHKQIKEKRLAYRINAIILLDQGFTYPEFEKVLLLDDRTIRRYRDLYLEKSIEGLLENNYPGGQRYSPNLNLIERLWKLFKKY